MLEDSASAIPSSMWASMNSWFTPTVLFLLLNLMIATILFTSTLSKNHQHQAPNPSTAIPRSPSLLQRLKSINFSAPHPQPHKPTPPDSPVDAIVHAQAHTHFHLDAHYFFSHHNPAEIVEASLQSQTVEALEIQPHSFIPEEKDPVPSLADFEEEKSMDEVYSQLTDSSSHFSRSQSDTKPIAGEIPAKLPTKMRKSASVKSAFAHFEEGDILEDRRPATVRERGDSRATAEVVDEEGVDAKADDFINRFKQQLKLQRLDSIVKYKDMIGRGRVCGDSFHLKEEEKSGFNYKVHAAQAQLSTWNGRPKF